MKKSLLIIYITFFISACLSAQVNKINWKSNTSINIYEETFKVLNFTDAIHVEENNYLPLYVHQEKLAHDNIDIKFLEGIISSIPNEQLIDIKGIETITDEFQFKHFFSYDRKQAVLNLHIIPLRYNKSLGIYEKLETFYYFIDDLGEIEKVATKSTKASNSVLSKGTWYKFFVSEDGMYKITYQDLKSLGVDVDNINPKTIQIFGNGGGMLPELAGAERYDDLNEVPIWVIGEEDGKFNNNDYILFYGSGPDSWTLEDKMFMFNRNLYTRKSGYFLTYSQTNGRRIENRESIVGKPNQTVTEFIDYQARETATSCPNKSGKKWYGETFDINTQQTFTFSFKNVNKNKSAKMFYEAAGRQFSRASFVTNVDNYSRTFTFDPVGTSLGSIYARTGTDYATFTPSSDNINVNMKYNRASSGDIAWLRCIYINVYSQLNYSSGNLFFRNDTSTLSGNVVEYKISTSSNIGNIKILDITKPAEPTQVIFTNNQSNITFPFYTDKVYQYICFDGSDTKSVEFQGGKIPNQNIHGKDIPDMVIVYKDILKDEVYRLYDFHVQTGLKTHMIDIQDIYNEFSSGVPDLCAIRDMMKMWYDKASYGNEPKYLLLVGRASYDPLDRINSNTNDILIHQSFDNMAALSVCTDDFYGYMDDNEGLFKNGDALDIAVGRIPTGFSHEVKNIIDKILHYTSNTESQQGDWKNIITFVADDADDNEDYHLRWAETYASIIEENHKEFNVNKIYAGAYTQITTAGGQRYPDVTAEINARLDKGTLIFVYSGHGGIKQLALEQLVSIADINSWKNYDRLTFFATATCSFTVFDDPGTISAGEMVLLNKKGGAVGMFTTTRITGSGNDALFRNFSRRIYKRDSNNNFKNIGDIIRETKNFQSTVIPNTRAYALLGDPAIPLNYPKYNSVNITKMLVDGVESDTLKAFSIVEIEGEVLDLYGNLMSDYNGIIYPEIHDKPLLLNTLGNDGADIQSFYSDNSIIYKGKSNIIDGKFKFSFIVPKDIAYKFGTAKMSFYYTNNEVDGNGYFDKYIVGGNTNPTEHDTQGPDIELYINDTLFINGGYTNENPVLLAKLFDKSGINTTGNGIGHDIIAYLDENTDRMYLMNTFYESDIDSYQSGKIRYPMFNLGSGLHKISIRAWDTYNNSSTADIEFLVISSDTIFLSDIYNYPNPFFDETTFVISHNQSGNIISASLYIASLSGQIINKIEKTFTSNNSNEKFLIWDGKTKNGTSINPGIYIYKIVLNNDSGKTTTRSGKLIKTISK